MTDMNATRTGPTQMLIALIVETVSECTGASTTNGW